MGRLSEYEDVNLNHQEVIERLCRLQQEVQAVLGYHVEADCFCGKGGFWGNGIYDGSEENGYRNDGVVLKFIETAVIEKLRTIERDSKSVAFDTLLGRA